MLIKDSLEQDGFKLRYYIEGEGVPVLIYGSAIYYQRIFPESLLNTCQMIYYDNRVFGGTCLKDASHDDFELDKLCADIETLRKKLKIEKFVIMGHSGQAYMVLEYAKKYPQHVSHVVMIGMAPTYDDKSHKWAEENWQALASEERKAALERNFKKWPDELVNSLPEPQNFAQAYVRNTPKIWFDYNFTGAGLLWQNVELNTKGFNYVWGQLFAQLDITQGLEHFNIPVAVMVGKYDGLVAPAESWQLVKNKFKQLKVFVFDESGHTPPLEEPDVFCKYFLQFIAK